MLKIRASSLGKIMAPAKKYSELSAGAKTYISELAKEHVYGFKREISSFAIEKGIIVEDDSIELYNSVFFTAHRKNEQRFENDWLCGTPDIMLLVPLRSLNSPAETTRHTPTQAARIWTAM
jgi:hypothetical protein